MHFRPGMPNGCSAVCPGLCTERRECAEKPVFVLEQKYAVGRVTTGSARDVYVQ